MTPERAPIDFPSLAGPVARALLGDPNPKLSTAAELRYGEHGRLSVRLAGERAGQWHDFRDGRGGGVLDLVIHEHQASDRAGAVRWLEAEGFTDSVRARESASTACPGMTACRRAGEGRATAYRQSSQSSRRVSARRLWDSTCPIAGTVAAAYLESRGVGHVARAPALRFHPRITHPNAPGHFPALVAGAQDVAGEFMGIHRTYLRADGTSKADIDPARLSLGPIGGGAVRLVEPAGDALLIGEGIETTAAAVKVLGWRGGAWAALSTSGMGKMVLPASVRRVLIAADRDVEGAGQKAAAQLTERLRAEGRRVRIFVPETIGHDFCDELNGGG